jgi:hypothetical protein
MENVITDSPLHKYTLKFKKKKKLSKAHGENNYESVYMKGEGTRTYR